MRLVHRIAPSGHLLEDVHVADDAELTPDLIAVYPPEGMQWPRWDGTAWIDAGVPFTIDPVTRAPILPAE